ncbi:carbohydrate kinase family protein [Lacrimispora amygdalina]|uniref:carbohydrate kinase family protein n=1 Tax=Lacrimispora amygdalina TaxID=253257 RepID=UPI001A9A6D0D|nr:carbohydrate kinase [Lacrimispora amygdalina]
MKKFDVVAIGELLIDMTDNGISEQGNTVFEANPGGAPCNVLAMLSKLNHSVSFVGKVGGDIFGWKLKRVLDEVGICSDYLCIDPDCRTTLAFVETKEGGDRDFSFYRNPGADMMLEKKDIDEEVLQNTKIFHFGTLSMTHDLVRNATKYAVETAKNCGELISFDPNIREPLWDSMELAREQVNYGLSMCDILKISDNEMEWLTGESDYSVGIAKIREKYSIPLILLSMGRDGSRAYYYGKSESIVVENKAFIQEGTIETTGAGDTFMACVLHFVLQVGLDQFNKEKLSEMLRFANVAASVITTRRGALRVMPSEKEIREILTR